MATRRVIVRFRAGPTWTSGGVREQPGWDAHAEFVDALVDAGTVVMGGPFVDNSGSLVVLDAPDEDAARAIVAGDPYLANGVFVLDEVRAWAVFVDARP